MLPRFLHPGRVLDVLDYIDAEQPSYTLSRPAALRRVLVVLACVSVSLLFIHYARFYSTLTTMLETLASWSGLPADRWTRTLSDSGFGQLIAYAWWFGVHFVGYVLFPMLVIRLLVRERVRDFGWKLNETRAHWRGYVLLVTPILLFVYLASLGQDFVNHYPFYRSAGRSVFDLLVWEALYIGQFICLEFFFRGFIVQSLRPAIGANAVWVMCVPYLMIHFPKLWPEAAGAVLFGLFLGILALRSRSIWGGVAVHVAIAVSMDLLALYRKGAIPSEWWP